MRRLALIFGAALLATTAAGAQEREKVEAAARAYVPQVVTTQHSGTFGGQRIRYSATIGETVLKNKDGVRPRRPSSPLLT